MRNRRHPMQIWAKGNSMKRKRFSNQPISDPLAAKLLPLSSRNGMSNMRVWPFTVEVLPDVPLVEPPPEEEVVPVFAEDIVFLDGCWVVFYSGLLSKSQVS
jgi:hypothetical protein